MSGLYIHVPFCRKACRYCDFCFTVSLQYIDAYIVCLVKEIKNAGNIVNEAFSTVYIGGGTPTVLSKRQIAAILAAIYEQFSVKNGAEVTIEANPDDLSEDYLKSLKDLGFNRLSIGVQSFFDEDIDLMNRSHRSLESIAAINRAVRAGFHSLNTDLIYGMPGLTIKKWEENLARIFDLPVQHLSAYHLTYEKDTVFELWRQQGRINITDEADSIAQYMLLREKASQYNFEHYEVSNFAVKEQRSKHNSIYWSGDTYIGFGPSAHSYDGNRRKWNIASVNKYIQNISAGKPHSKTEVLSESEKYNEFLITRLRTSEGVNLEHVKDRFGNKVLEDLVSKAGHHIQYRPEEMLLSNEILKITPEGWLRLDHITRNLMRD
ncbi:MAG: radical SAM family heme chaperone HemW [Bacteroidales bacterium]|nr:radical SAM family heme chaperone HemW [Bacteroidales bacterium]